MKNILIILSAILLTSCATGTLTETIEKNKSQVIDKQTIHTTDADTGEEILVDIEDQRSVHNVKTVALSLGYIVTVPVDIAMGTAVVATVIPLVLLHGGHHH